MAARARAAVLSERAIALRPVVLSSSRLASSAGDEDAWVELAYDAAALAREEAEEIARLDADGARATPGRVRCRRSDLEALRARAPSAELLLAACANERAPEAAPRLMGVLNVTPDSFSDGGLYLDPGRAVDRALEMVDEGARVIDVGGESTRPGSQGVSVEVELARVLPVLEALAVEVQVPLSIDTSKAEVAARALDAGASIVNDVSAARSDPRMLPLVAARGCTLLLMHMQGTPRDMQAAPRYRDVVSEVIEFLRSRAAAAVAAGIASECLWIDPGIGFGKTIEHNLELLARLRCLRSLGLPVCVGVSRKSFIAKLDEVAGQASDRPGRDRPARDRIGGTAAAVTSCVLSGASMLRVHDVRVMAEAVRVAWAVAQQRA